MKERVFKSMAKYVTQFDFDLAGQTFNLVMDDGHEYVANFVSGEIVLWAERGEPFRWEKYDCLKSDETTFFVRMELFGVTPRTCRVLVLDLEHQLVTMHVARQGGIPSRPRMVETTIIFGALRVAGQPLPFIRHGYTADLVGKKITWHYASGFINTHIYQSESYYRIRPLNQPAPAAGEAVAPVRLLYEEPSRFVKIKDGIYLCSFIEENMNKQDNLIGGNNLLLLMNLSEGFDVGRTFCLNAAQQPESGMFSSFCETTDEDIDLEHLPSPYRV